MELRTLLVVVLGSTCFMLAAGKGIPFCAPGLLSCGTAGCYSNLLTQCIELDGTKQCRPVGIMQQLSLLMSPSRENGCRVGYINTCGEHYCNNEELCTVGGCVPMQTSTNSSTAPQQSNRRSPLDMCLDARNASGGCNADASGLEKVPCNDIGVASILGVTCYQSQLFNCAAGNGDSVSTCRGLAMAAVAVRDAMDNSTNGNTSAAVTYANNTSFLQPLFNGLSHVVSNVSQSLFNISMPAYNSSRNNSRVYFEPPDGTNAAGSNNPISKCLKMLVQAQILLVLVLLIL